MHHHPFRGIESDRIGEFDTVQPVTEFRTEEGSSSVGCVNMQPQILLAAFLIENIKSMNTTNLKYILIFECYTIYFSAHNRDLHTIPISRRWSKAQAPVVPKVAQTYK